MRSSASRFSFALAAFGALVATLLLLAVDAQPLTPTMTSTTTRATIPSPSSSSAACPYISYTQALRPVTGTAAWIADDLPQYKLAFVNHSPQHALSQLDVQYRVNDGALVNVRLIGEQVQAQQQPHEQQPREQRYSLGTAPPFILRAGDRVEYRFTYKPVDAPGLTCETPMFHVSGRELAAISSQSAGIVATPRTMPAAAPMSTAPMETRADMAHQANVVNVMADMRAAAPNARVSAATAMAAAASHAQAQVQAQAQGHAQAQAITASVPPSVHLEETAMERNADVCPLLPFTQQIHRTPSSDPRHPFRYTLRFENLSPSLSLTFLDAHVQINDGSVSNFRLFSDPSLSNKANQARALEGLPLDANDTLLYAFTYGVGTRACNTPTYKYHVE